MSGLFGNWPTIGAYDGTETGVLDTGNLAGENPESGKMTLLQLATAMKNLGSTVSHATVAGTRYYQNFSLGVQTKITGLEVLVGATGGTDNWIVELHDSTGALVATSALAGTLAGTANQFQRIAFTAPYTALAGTYYLALQSNGNTATYGAYVTPAQGAALNGSAGGVFGTSAAITPPTTWTQGLGPMMDLY